MSGSYKSVVKKPCACGGNRWRTKGDSQTCCMTEYACRKCGAVRAVTAEESMGNIIPEKVQTEPGMPQNDVR